MTDQKPKTNRQRTKAYVKYSGMAYQLFGLLALSIYLGIKLDAYLGNEKRYMTALICLIVLTGFLYNVVRTVK